MRRTVWLVATAVGLAAVLRQRREAVRTRAGALPPVGAAGHAPGEQDSGRVHDAVGGWQPTRPRTSTGRLAAALWAGPLTLLGMAVGLLGGVVPQWDAAHGAWVVRSVGGPARWFLRFQSANAATLGQVVVLRDATADDRLLAHEALHARQQERLGPLFAVAYPVASALWGYRRNPFEVAARAAARLSGPAGTA